jgi:hypothetical protein
LTRLQRFSKRGSKIFKTKETRRKLGVGVMSQRNMINALTTPDVLVSLVKKGLIDKYLDCYESIYVAYPYPFFFCSSEISMEKISELQVKKRLILINLYDYQKLQQEYNDIIKESVNVGEVERPTPAERFLELYLAPLFEWASRLNAALLLPEESPFKDIADELEKMGRVVKI